MISGGRGGRKRPILGSPSPSPYATTRLHGPYAHRLQFSSGYNRDTRPMQFDERPMQFNENDMRFEGEEAMHENAGYEHDYSFPRGDFQTPDRHTRQSFHRNAPTPPSRMFDTPLRGGTGQQNQADFTEDEYLIMQERIYELSEVVRLQQAEIAQLKAAVQFQPVEEGALQAQVKEEVAKFCSENVRSFIKEALNDLSNKDCEEGGSGGGVIEGLKNLKDLQAANVEHEKKLAEVVKDFQKCKEEMLGSASTEATVGQWYSVKGFGFDIFGVPVDTSKESIIRMLKTACGLSVGADLAYSNVYRWRHRADAKKVNWSFTIHNEKYIPCFTYRLHNSHSASDPKLFVAPSLTDTERAQKKSLKSIADFLAATHYLRWRRDVLYVVPKLADDQHKTDKSDWIRVDVISATKVEVAGVVMLYMRCLTWERVLLCLWSPQKSKYLQCAMCALEC